MELSNILSYLLFFLLIWFMFRRGGCCGGHMHHTSHQTSHEKEPGKDTAKDPVCGMTVRKEEAIHRSYNGQEYYFCSERCLQAFEDNRNKPVL